MSDLLSAAKRVLAKVVLTGNTEGDMLGLFALSQLQEAVRREEELMQREADWYQHQYDHAQREYNEMMLRGEE